MHNVDHNYIISMINSIFSKWIFYIKCFVYHVTFLFTTFAKMVNIKFEAQRQTIKHYWNIGIRLTKQIHEITSIPLYTVEYNLKKLKEIGDVKHKQRIGRPLKVTQEISQMIRQNIRRNNTISTRQLAI